MKKNIFSVFALVALIFTIGCEKNDNSTSTNKNSSNTNSVSQTTSENYNDGKYRVIVLYPNGERAPKDIEVQWCKDTLCNPAKTDNNGVATIELEDNDYEIHLFNLPDGYAYQPGKYFANAENRTISITLNEILTPTSGDGTNYDSYIIGEGVYKATISSAEEVSYFGFKPYRPGKYKIESWTDKVELINASLGYYGNNNSFVPDTPLATDDDSGINDNFSYNFNIAIDEFINTGEVDKEGNVIYEKDENGNYVPGGLYVFGLSANVKRTKSFNFAITYEGEYVREEVKIEEVKVKAELSKYPDAKEDDVYKEMPLDGTIDAFYSETDGFYHAKSIDGPILLAKISEPCPYMDKAFSKVNEETGANEGIVSVTGIVLDNGKKDYTNFVQEYEEYCNSDGVYGVNQELKTFLEYYYLSIEQWLSSTSQTVVDPESGWMFACGFYTDIADSYTSPWDGKGTSEEPYWLNADTYYVKVNAGESIYYQFYVKNTIIEQYVFVKSEDPNCKLIYNGTSYSSDTGAYFEVLVGGTSNPSGILFEVTTVNGDSDGFPFEIGIKEITVAGDAIAIGDNTVEVMEMGVVECSFTASKKGIYTISSVESNALFEDSDKNTYSSSTEEISFSTQLNAGDTLTFNVYTVNFEHDYITFTLSFEPLANLGLNTALVQEWEVLEYAYIAEEAGTYKVYSTDVNISLGCNEGNVTTWKWYNANSSEECAFTFKVEANETFNFYVTTADYMTHPVRFTIEKTA